MHRGDTPRGRGQVPRRGRFFGRRAIPGRSPISRWGRILGRRRFPGRGAIPGPAVGPMRLPHRFIFGSAPPTFDQPLHRGDYHFQPSPTNQFEIYSHGTVSFLPLRNRFPECLEKSPVGFYIVRVYPGLTERNQSLLLTLLSHQLNDGEILPFEPKSNFDCFSFYVNNHKTAQKLHALSTVFLPDGTQRIIQVQRKTPVFRMDANMKEAITAVLIGAFNPQSKAAVLSKFNTNAIFIEKKLICSLNLPSTWEHVADILYSMAPSLYALNLNENRLTSLEETGRALSRFTCLRVLHLAGNQIGNIAELGYLSGLSLTELDLRDNDFASLLHVCDYVKEVRSMFPSLQVLDGELLSQRIPCVLHLDVPEKLPPWKASYAPECEMLPAIAKFAHRYFELYDEVGRDKLTEVYHHQAVMSLVCDLSGGSKKRLHAYLRYDRNLLLPANQLVGNSAPLLFRGPEAILSALKTLPNTEHYFQTFTVDVVPIGTSTVQLLVSGLFREFTSGHSRSVGGRPVKHFNRCLILCREGDEFQIVNDSLVIRYPSNSQLTKVEQIKSQLSDLRLNRSHVMKQFGNLSIKE